MKEGLKIEMTNYCKMWLKMGQDNFTSATSKTFFAPEAVSKCFLPERLAE
jgi:hypothetical protein